MTPRIPESVSSWLVDWSFAPIMGNTMPPRDPNDDDDAEDKDEDAEPNDSSRRSSENPTNSATELQLRRPSLPDT